MSEQYTEGGGGGEVQYTEKRVLSTSGGYDDYTGGLRCSVHQRDTINTPEAYHNECVCVGGGGGGRGVSRIHRKFSVLRVSNQIQWFINVLSQTNHGIPRCTHGIPRCTHDILQVY